jgi:hypothetical protein
MKCGLEHKKNTHVHKVAEQEINFQKTSFGPIINYDDCVKGYCTYVRKGLVERAAEQEQRWLCPNQPPLLPPALLSLICFHGMSRRSVQAMSVKELPVQDKAMAEFLGTVNIGQGEGPVDRTSEEQHNISREMHPSVSIRSCWAEPTFEEACELNQATVHCVTSGKAPGAGATKPKCVEKKLICEFFEAMLQILAKYHKATMPITTIGQISGKNPRFEAVGEWAKQSFHESLVSISMVDDALFEKYHFQAWKDRSTLCIMCLGCKIKRSFLYLAPWILKWC